MFKIMLLAAILPLAAAPALADDLKPLQGSRADFVGGASMLVYFTAEPDGFHVVTTMQSNDTPDQVVFRFVTTLGPGQSATVSVPHAAGQDPEAVTLANGGDMLRMTRSEAPAGGAMRASR